MLIPLIAAIIPIRVALKKQLGESLDNSRSKTKGILINITNGEDHSAGIISGSLFVIYGAAIYYLLP
jgi:hypothetical protein